MLIPTSSCLAVVLGAATTSAFLIPSTVAAPAGLQEDGLDALNSLNHRKLNIASLLSFVDCTGCDWPFPSETENSILVSGILDIIINIQYLPYDRA